MAASLLLLLDDIATVLDDVSILTKVAAKKTAGVLGDDLALNAQQVSGVKADRELPVVWAVAKGSFVNKAILVPAALLIATFLPWAVTPLLMVGGAFLCFEGVEKLAHSFLHKKEHEASVKHHVDAVADPAIDVAAVEKAKIKGAVRTDFILSAEIIVISLSTVTGQPFMTKLAVLVGIAIIMTVGVYGLVAGIVKLATHPEVVGLPGVHAGRPDVRGEELGELRGELGIALVRGREVALLEVGLPATGDGHLRVRRRPPALVPVRRSRELLLVGRR